jgi:hypothetical protein
VAVGAAGVAGDQEPRGARVGALARQVPPAADGLHGEGGGVPVGAHVHEPGVRVLVVDPVGDRVPPVFPGEVVGGDHDGAPLRPPLPAGLAVVADLLAFLGVHADHRLPRVPVLRGLRGDVAELGVPVRVLPALGRLGVGLHGEPGLLQHPPAGLRAARAPLRGQLAGQALHALRRPHQRRFRIPPDGVRDQREQGRQQPGVGLGQRPAAAAGPPEPARRRAVPGAGLGGAVGDGLPRRPGQGRDRARPALAGGPRRHPQHQPPGPLIQHRQQQLQFRPHPPQKIRVRAHNRILSRDTLETHVDLERCHSAQKRSRS